MATKTLHLDIYRYGLNEFVTVATAGNLRLIICAGTPASVTEARTLYDGSAGKARLSNEITVNAGDISFSNTATTLTATFAAKSGTFAATKAAGDLSFVLVDINGTTPRLLYIGEETTDQAVTNGNTFNLPSFTITSGPVS